MGIESVAEIGSGRQRERVRESLLVDGRQVVPEAMAARLQRAQATEAGQAAGSVKASSPVWAVLVWTGPGPGLAWHFWHLSLVGQNFRYMFGVGGWHCLGGSFDSSSAHIVGFALG